MYYICMLYHSFQVLQLYSGMLAGTVQMATEAICTKNYVGCLFLLTLGG